MRILITGSCGFIATTLINKLHAAGHSLVGIDSLVSGSTNLQYTQSICTHSHFDLQDDQKLEQALSGVDCVFHLAAKGNVIESIENPLENFDFNTHATLRLLLAMSKVGVKNIIFSSTGGALMGNAIPPVNEGTVPNPISPYGASKLACEGYISSFCASFGFSSIVLRFGNVYGPYSSHKVGVINKWIRSTLSKSPLVIFGDGNSSRDYIHVDDLTDGLLLALNRLQSLPSSSRETYHLANSCEIRLNELKDILSAVCGYSLDTLVVYKDARIGEVGRNFADTSLAQRYLGFSPSVSFEDGIANLYHWLMLNEFSPL